MQIFHIISIVVPLTIALCLPWWLQKHGKNEQPYRWLLYLACVLFFISWYLPSPLIEGRDTSFVTHIIGGGIFTGLLWVYLKKAFRWHAHWLFEFALLFALVSTLGAVNELAELYMVKTGIAVIVLDDTNWDILANTLGAAAVFVINKLIKQ